MNIKFQALNDDLAKTTSTKEFVETLVDGLTAAFISVADEEGKVKALASELLRDRSQFLLSLPTSEVQYVSVGTAPTELSDDEKVHAVATNPGLLAKLFASLKSNG